MKMNFNDVLYACSYALDCVEHELLGATTNHGKRVAYISAMLGKNLGMGEDELLDLSACAVLHDNALTEYIKTEFNKELLDKAEKSEIGIHCTMGENNIVNLPFRTNVEGAILYHHENMDGSGVFGKEKSEIPLMAQLIHFGDILDVQCDLGAYSEEKYQEVVHYLRESAGTLFAKEHVDLFFAVFPKEVLGQIEGSRIDALLEELLPKRITDCEGDTLYRLADMFAKIIDYKSEFTRLHSLGIAQKAAEMGKYYGYDKETIQKLYFAGAVHDIGKLVVDRDILEKPGKLDQKEYAHIQTHAWYSYQILHKIDGFEEITEWAALHHEKLDGSGYPFGRTGETLDKNSRLMACLDIYQALTESRPYKECMPHEKVMGILREMGQKGTLDTGIIADIDCVFAGK